MPLEEINYEELNPGIRQTVRWLRQLGFDTTDSGDGKTHEHECDRDCAYVTIRVDPENMAAECKRLSRELQRLGCDLTYHYNRIGEAYEAGEDYEELKVPFLQANYSPVDDEAILDLVNVDDAFLFVKN